MCDLEFVGAESNQKLAELLGTLAIEMQAHSANLILLILTLGCRKWVNLAVL